MAVAQTKAASIMAQNAADMTSHQVISLLLDGALERVAQAKHAISTGNDADKAILIGKLVAIIKGLRNSLNLRDGGVIADNLDALYEYIIARIEGASTLEEYATMVEVGKLLGEVKEGWDNIDLALCAQIA